jgi:Cof subfamily protein (haloacid dehalogenase superfamily)
MHLVDSRSFAASQRSGLQLSVAKHPVRLIAVDIDGTLTDPEYKISARNYEALREAHRAGIQIVLATGRRHDYALPVARELGFPIWLISSNGALVRSSEGETDVTDRLPASSARKLIQHMDNFRGNAVLTFDRPADLNGNNSLVLERVDELNQSISRWMEANRPHIKIVSPLEDALTEDPLQAMYCGSVARMVQAQQRLAEANFGDELTIMRTQYDHRDLCILDILTRDCSKGHALRRLAEKHDISPDGIMAIGDNYNDLEMLEFAGVPVVMANADAGLKQLGFHVTGSNSESGVALAIEQLFGAGFPALIRGQ